MRKRDYLLSMKLAVADILKDAWGCSYAEIAEILDKYSLLEYMNDCDYYYNSIGAPRIVEDIEDEIQRRSGEIHQ